MKNTFIELQHFASTFLIDIESLKHEIDKLVEINNKLDSLTINEIIEIHQNLTIKNFEKIIYIRYISDFNELKYFKDNLKYFDNNISFIIFTPIPNFYGNKIKPVECLIQNKECSFHADEDFRNRNLKNLYKELDNFKENIGNINLFYFNPYKVLCPAKNCNVYNTNNRILTYRDNNHLTIEGSLLLKTEFNFFLKNNDIY
jgi:hypothetical protein